MSLGLCKGPNRVAFFYPTHFSGSWGKKRPALFFAGVALFYPMIFFEVFIILACIDVMLCIYYVHVYIIWIVFQVNLIVLKLWFIGKSNRFEMYVHYREKDQLHYLVGQPYNYFKNTPSIGLFDIHYQIHYQKAYFLFTVFDFLIQWLTSSQNCPTIIMAHDMHICPGEVKNW